MERQQSPPIRHLFAENAAPHSNDSNGEVDLPQMMAVECPHWADSVEKAADFRAFLAQSMRMQLRQQ